MSLRAKFRTRDGPCVLKWSDSNEDGKKCERVHLMATDGDWWAAWYWGRGDTMPDVLHIFYGHERQVKLRLRRIFRQSVRTIKLGKAVIDKPEQMTVKCHFCGGTGKYNILWGEGHKVVEPCKTCWGIGDLETTPHEQEYERRQSLYMKELDEELGLV